MTMTFLQFQGTRVWSENLAADVTSENWAEVGNTPKGWLYLGCLYIEEVQPYWPQAARDEGKWYLILGRDEYITDDLLALEQKLCDYANAEGFEPDGWQGPVPTGDLKQIAFAEEPEGASMDDLIHEYQRWNKANGLDLGSADEHLFDENLNETQQAYLQGFCRRWDECMEREDMERAIERRADEDGTNDRLRKATPLLLKALRLVEQDMHNAYDDGPVSLDDETVAAVQAALDALDGK